MLRLEHGDSEMELRTLPHFALDPDAAAMRFDEMLGDGKAEAGTADFSRPCNINAVEALKDAGLVRSGNADSGVRNGESNLASVGGSGNHDLAAGRRVLNGVIQQVLQHLGKTAAVGGNIRKRPLQ